MILGLLAFCTGFIAARTMYWLQVGNPLHSKLGVWLLLAFVSATIIAYFTT